MLVFHSSVGVLVLRPRCGWCCGGCGGGGIAVLGVIVGDVVLAVPFWVAGVVAMLVVFGRAFVRDIVVPCVVLLWRDFC